MICRQVATRKDVIFFSNLEQQWMVDLFYIYKVEKSYSYCLLSESRQEKKLKNYSDSYQNGGGRRDTDFQKLAQN